MSEQKEKLTKSIVFKTWFYFVLLSFAIVLFLWFSEILLFNIFYRTTRKSQVVSSAESVVINFKTARPDSFEEYLDATAKNQDLMVMIFSLKEVADVSNITLEQMNIICFADGMNKVYGEVNKNPDDIFLPNGDYFTRALSSPAGEVFSYNFSEESADKYLVCGNLNNTAAGKVYFYFVSAVAPSTITTGIFLNQFLMLSCMALIMALIVAMIISKRITAPITGFVEKARQFGKGDYSVTFEGNGDNEYEELAKALNYSMGELAKTEQLRRDFIANISHDLRTPLTMVKAYAEMIHDISGGDEKKRLQHSQVIIDEVDRLTTLVNDLLDVSKYQSSTQEMSLKSVDLSLLTRTVLDRFTPFEEREGYTIKSELEENCVVICDDKKITQVLYNLISNACNYTGEDKTIRVKVFRVKDGKIRCEVIDSGKGIPADEIDSVWERYYRASQTKRVIVGTGLGLSIVKNILIAHEAEYGIISEVGKGSNFWFEMNTSTEVVLNAKHLTAKDAKAKKKIK